MAVVLFAAACQVSAHEQVSQRLDTESADPRVRTSKFRGPMEFGLNIDPNLIEGIDSPTDSRLFVEVEYQYPIDVPASETKVLKRSIADGAFAYPSDYHVLF